MELLKMNQPPFTAAEMAIIKQYLFNNIATSENVFTKRIRYQTIQSIPGAVIASPSIPGVNFSQDYFFEWVRDAAITMEEVCYLYEHASEKEEKERLKPYLVNYIHWVKHAQEHPALNGVDILGDPKFNIDGTLFTGEWARPQNDGPALRAITCIHIANLFLKEEGNAEHLNLLYSETGSSIIKTDLEYTAKNWPNKSIELWEEVLGYQFFTLAVQRRALFEGSVLANSLGDTEAANFYRDQARFIEKLMDEHWHEGLGYYTETLTSVGNKGGGLTISVLMGLLYGKLHKFEDKFSISHYKSVSSAFYIRDTFENLYQINVKAKERGHGGPFIGRYQNDIYDGYQETYGHPWILTTNLFAEFYYSLVGELLREKGIEITFLTKQFYQQTCPELKLTSETLITQEKDPKLFSSIISGLMSAGDDMLKCVKNHSETYEDGTPLHLSEQIDRSHGNPVSAADLTWSYATLLTAMQAREKTMALMISLKKD